MPESNLLSFSFASDEHVSSCLHDDLSRNHQAEQRKRDVQTKVRENLVEQQAEQIGRSISHETGNECVEISRLESGQSLNCQLRHECANCEENNGDEPKCFKSNAMFMLQWSSSASRIICFGSLSDRKPR